MTTEFKDTDLYKWGQYYKGLGELMINPNTSIIELIDYCESYGIDLQIRFAPIPSNKPNQGSD